MKTVSDVWSEKEHAEIQKMCDTVMSGGVVWLKTSENDVNAGYHFQTRCEVYAADPDIGITIVFNDWGSYHRTPAVCLVGSQCSSHVEPFRHLLRRVLESCIDGCVDITNIGQEIGRPPCIKDEPDCAFQ